jgi:adenosyl cobinamide kinase/adenosyl cobinamide phosphate guanylyltransferase
MPVCLLIGGVRSGKSRLALRLAAREQRSVVVIATAEARDAEMAARITQHRRERPAEWTTIEEPVDLRSAFAVAPEEAVVLVDCLTLWVSNLMEREVPDVEIEARAERAARIAAARPQQVIVVTNEVGSGVIPTNPLGRRFGDVLGRVNMLWADRAERSALVVAGKMLSLQDLPGD